jgi:DNA-binding response OmpR family regulator
MNRDIGRILIVDNEPNVRLVFRTAMESAGHTVDEAEDGEAALECLRRGGFDLLLLDLQMPGLGGMDVLRRLRDGGDDVPVVVATAHGSIPDAVAAMKLGAIDFLTKPIKPEVLRGVVGDVLRRHARPASAPARGHGGADGDAGGADATGVDGLSPARRALNRREFDRAHDLLEETLKSAPDSPEAHNLLGVLRETLGQDRAAYEAYRTALEIDPRYVPALDNMRRYCDRVGLDARNWSINPGAE